MTYSAEVNQIFNELSQVPMGQMLVDRAMRVPIDIALHQDRDHLKSVADYNYRTKRLRSSTSCIAVIAHELRHHDQYQRLEDMGVHIQNLSSHQKFQLRHLNEADAYAYASMTCLQLSAYYNEKGQGRQAFTSFKHASAMYDILRFADVPNAVSNQQALNKTGIRLFNEYAKPQSQAWQMLQDNYSSTFCTELPQTPNSDLFVASLLTLAAPAASFASLQEGAPLVSLGFAALSAVAGIKIGRASAMFCYAAMASDDPTLFSRVMNTYGQMPDGSNYLQDMPENPHLVMPSAVLDERVRRVKKAIRFSPLYHGWRLVKPKR